ncbi:MAG: 2-C-methyl-D-erythritol 4-phosphate cytidylyltransferase [Mageeibacillus sp.]|jgi:2-C-methyl-D-erythritol 4-phosphate cytidylyltransferase|nr:2-C-methyl-D-erythritol 4-phosphate cytidylyltransferase [Mageeibacillus sp.]MCI1264297.1 2-C-methyl-D-erythritol 4-phosphate cytidylyltransferase [Saccharofermentans sp.]MCI2044461.1 2-C-methyl-D-erythritol 4-phosphate cytidylyltransferase [Mageeibacillus sp.]
MNYAIILAAGVGQRMRNSGRPKQFLEVYGRPIIIHTLEKFEACLDIDSIVVVCNASWIDYMNDLVKRFEVRKVAAVVPGGSSRAESIMNGLEPVRACAGEDDIVVIHDGVRPLVDVNIISENIRVAKQYGSAITVHPAAESIVITSGEEAEFADFRKRDDTYTLTSPQTFRLQLISQTYASTTDKSEDGLPLLDTALAYASLGNSVHIVRENNHNIKITTPEDFYMLKALLELEENKSVFGIN